jgi:predicted HicB family RNase H-like nuclease
MEGARKISPLQVRFPPELKEWLKAQALQNRRSLNSEIVTLLEQVRASVEASTGVQ